MMLKSKRVLVLGDTHIGLPFPDNRLEDSLINFANLCADHRPDHIVQLGDCFNSKRPVSSSVEFATIFFGALAEIAPVTVIAGGHDQDAHQGYNAVDFLDDVSPNIEVITKFMLKDDFLLFAPYTRKLTKQHLMQIQGARVRFLHQGISEALFDNSNRKYGLMPDSVPIEYLTEGLTVCGHIHTPWVNEKGNIICLGSPYQTQYRHMICERGCLLIDLIDYMNPEFIPLDTFRLKRITITVPVDISEDKAILEHVIKVLPVPEKNTYYSVTVAVESDGGRNVIKGIKDTVNTVYFHCCDNVQVSFILPKSERTVYNNLKTVSQSIENKDPVELFALYCEVKNDAYFKARPHLQEACVVELRDVIAQVDRKMG